MDPVAVAVAAAADSSTAAVARLLLIAPHGSYRTVPFIEAAAARGAEVLIASESRHSLVSAYARGLHVDFTDPDGALRVLVEEARARPFAAIIGTDDSSTELASRVSAALALRHNPAEAVRLARRKDLARGRLAECGVSVPWHRRLDLELPLVEQISDIPYPCVLKPVGLAASRGVIRADDPPALQAAAARISRILSEVRDAEERRYILVEQFIPGFEVAVEGLLTDGQLQVLAIFDKPDPLDGPFFEETYYITPSRLSGDSQFQLRHALDSACRAYGLREGPIHAECRINQNGVWILEVAARTIGGLCGRLLRFGTGHSLEQIVLAHALGDVVEARTEDGGAGVLMIPIPRSGILRRVEGVLAASRVPGIEDVVIDVREGYELVPLPEGSNYLGFIFARASSPAEAEAALRVAHGCLNIVVAPLWKGAFRGAAAG
ncbi:MAG: ATP-grasp domain-containing protein [Acidiferrobacterales bacterium]